MEALDYHLKNPLYANWVKSTLALNIINAVLRPYVFDEVVKIHRSIISRRPAGVTCEKCCLGQAPRCPMNFCNIIKKEIEENHRYGKPSFDNTNTKNWKSDAWEIAKCFMPVNKGCRKCTSSNADFSATVNIFINCNAFDTLVSCDLDKSGNIFSEARKIRNDLMHSHELKVSEFDLQSNLNLLISLLNEIKTKPTNFPEAREKITKLMEGKLKISVEDVIDARTQYLLEKGTTKKYVDDQMANLRQEIQEVKEAASILRVPHHGLMDKFVKCCKHSLVKKMERQIDIMRPKNCSKDKWNLSRFLYKIEWKSEIELLSELQRRLLFPDDGNIANINKWDLFLLCHILSIELGGQPDDALKKYIKKLKDIRDEFLTNPDGVTDLNALAELLQEPLKGEVLNICARVDITYDAASLHSQLTLWHQAEENMKNARVNAKTLAEVNHVLTDVADLKKSVSEIIRTLGLETDGGKDADGNSDKIETCVSVEAKNLDREEKKKLQKNMTSKSKDENVLYRNGAIHQFQKAIKAENIQVDQGSIIFRQSFESIEDLMDFWNSCTDGRAVKALSKIRDDYREFLKCDSLDLDIVLTQKEVFRCLKRLVEDLSSQFKDERIFGAVRSKAPTLEVKPVPQHKLIGNFVKGCKYSLVKIMESLIDKVRPKGWSRHEWNLRSFLDKLGWTLEIRSLSQLHMRLLYPEDGNTVDINDWDLFLLCHILSIDSVFELDNNEKNYIQEIKNLRDKILTHPDKISEEDLKVLADFLEEPLKHEIINIYGGEDINDDAVKLHTILKVWRQEEENMEYIQISTTALRKEEKNAARIEELESQLKKLYELLEYKTDMGSKPEGYDQGIETCIQVTPKHCDKKDEEQVQDNMTSEDETKNIFLANSGRNDFCEQLNVKTAKLIKGNNIMKVTCETIKDLVRFWDSCTDGGALRALSQVRDEYRNFLRCDTFDFDIILTKKEVYRCMDYLVERLSSWIPDISVLEKVLDEAEDASKVEMEIVTDESDCKTGITTFGAEVLEDVQHFGRKATTSGIALETRIASFGARRMEDIKQFEEESQSSSETFKQTPVNLDEVHNVSEEVHDEHMELEELYTNTLKQNEKIAARLDVLENQLLQRIVLVRNRTQIGSMPDGYGQGIETVISIKPKYCTREEMEKLQDNITSNNGEENIAIAQGGIHCFQTELNLQGIQPAKGSIILKVTCKFVNDLLLFWESCMNGKALRALSKIRDDYRQFLDCNTLDFDIVLTKKEVNRCMNQLVMPSITAVKEGVKRGEEKVVMRMKSLIGPDIPEESEREEYISEDTKKLSLDVHKQGSSGQVTFKKGTKFSEYDATRLVKFLEEIAENFEEGKISVIKPYLVQLIKHSKDRDKEAFEKVIMDFTEATKFRSGISVTLLKQAYRGFRMILTEPEFGDLVAAKVAAIGKQEEPMGGVEKIRWQIDSKISVKDIQVGDKIAKEPSQTSDTGYGKPDKRAGTSKGFEYRVTEKDVSSGSKLRPIQEFKKDVSSSKVESLKRKSTELAMEEDKPKSMDSMSFKRKPGSPGSVEATETSTVPKS